MIPGCFLGGDLLKLGAVTVDSYDLSAGMFKQFFHGKDLHSPRVFQSMRGAAGALSRRPAGVAEMRAKR